MRAPFAPLALCSILVGCTSATPLSNDPAATPQGERPSLGSIALDDGTSLSAAGLFNIRLDPVALTAEVTPLAARSAQDNDDLYQLPINSFVGSDTLTISDLTVDVDSLTLTYAIRHPFEAPADLDGPATATNRADLGVAGMVCLLIDAPTASGYTWFDTEPTAGPVTMHDWAVTNPDGFYVPAGLVDTSALTATAFPYKILVDELLDPRTSRSGAPISNLGLTEGNYDFDMKGWQRGNIGPNNDGWTGYGVLHQGQTATNAFDISFSYLNSSVLDLTAAILVKYVDPRQGASAAVRKANRLPAEPPDVTRFAYRMAYGAMDAERMTYLGEIGGLIAGQDSTTTINFRGVDWDARYPETTSDPLSADPFVQTISVGTSGELFCRFELPGILPDTLNLVLTHDDSAFGGDPEPDDGIPGDEFLYSQQLDILATDPVAPGTYVGMTYARDDAPADTLPLDGDLQPLTGNFPTPQIYQRFTIEVQ